MHGRRARIPEAGIRTREWRGGGTSKMERISKVDDKLKHGSQDAVVRRGVSVSHSKVQAVTRSSPLQFPSKQESSCHGVPFVRTRDLSDRLKWTKTIKLLFNEKWKPDLRHGTFRFIHF